MGFLYSILIFGFDTGSPVKLLLSGGLCGGAQSSLGTVSARWGGRVPLLRPVEPRASVQPKTIVGKAETGMHPQNH